MLELNFQSSGSARAHLFRARPITKFYDSQHQQHFMSRIACLLPVVVVELDLSKNCYLTLALSVISRDELELINSQKVTADRLKFE